MKSKSKFSLYRFTVSQLILILGGIILIAPLVLTIGSNWAPWDFSETGQIGDTLGGITAPFISAFAAILVFVAFKEQVKANDLIKENQTIELIQLELHRIEDDCYRIQELKQQISNLIEQQNAVKMQVKYPRKYIMELGSLTKLSHLHNVLYFILDVINSLQDNEKKMLFKNRLIDIYGFLYFININELINKFSYKPDFEEHIIEYISVSKTSINKFREELEIPKV